MCFQPKVVPGERERTFFLKKIYIQAQLLGPGLFLYSKVEKLNYRIIWTRRMFFGREVWRFTNYSVILPSTLLSYRQIPEQNDTSFILGCTNFKIVIMGTIFTYWLHSPSLLDIDTVSRD